MATATRARATRNGASAARSVHEGIIESKNEWGIRLGGQWFNYSQYPGAQESDFPEHFEGDAVKIEVTGDKWLAGLELDPFQDAPADPRDRITPAVKSMAQVSRRPSSLLQGPVQDGPNGNYRKLLDGPLVIPKGRELSAMDAHLDKDRSIVRQVCIKAAAELTSGAIAAWPDHFDDPTTWLLDQAARIEAWIWRTEVA